MRKFTVVLLVFTFAILGVFPGFAQDEPGTIADIVVASATGDEPQFTTLLAAIQAADPAILEALSDPEASLTVFAPTDEAFAELAEELGEEAFGEVLADADLLSSVLLYHVIDGVVDSSTVVGLLEENDGYFSGPTLNGQYLDVEGSLEDGISIDDADLILDMVDIQASNGVIHVIDTVLLPETRTIAEIIVDAVEMDDMDEEEMEEMDEEAEVEFSFLLTAVQAADPAVLETLSDPEAELTVFAPTDEAFIALSEALGEEAFNGILADTDALSNILLYHVVPAVVYSSDLGDMLTERGEMSEDDASIILEVEMANGGAATITASDEGIFINDAEIIITDIDAINGVIHVIDAVIVPPSE